MYRKFLHKDIIFTAVDLDNSQPEPDSTTLEESIDSSSREEEVNSHLEFIAEEERNTLHQYGTVDLHLHNLGKLFFMGAAQFTNGNFVGKFYLIELSWKSWNWIVIYLKFTFAFHGNWKML